MNTKSIDRLSDVLQTPDAFTISNMWRCRRVEFIGEIDKSIEIVASFHFDSADIGKLHQRQMRPALLTKHAIPYVLALADFTGDHESVFDHHLLAGCLAVHTLALTQLDYHMDGIDPPSGDFTATAAKVELQDAVAYSVAVMYRGFAELCNSRYGARIISEVVGPISGFTAERMYQDYVDRHERFRQVLMSAQSSTYLEQPFSRLLASGYWELMIKSAAICSSNEFTPAMAKFCKRLRTLRQIVDERIDIEEDIRSGLVTLPAILARELYLQRDEGAEPVSVNLGESAYRSAYATWTRDFAARADFTKSYDEIVFDIANDALAIAADNGWHNLADLVRAKVAKYLLGRDQPPHHNR